MGRAPGRPWGGRVNSLILLAGLPRSGSTWLGAILAQNPQFYVTFQSPFLELLWRNFSLWDDQSWKANFSVDGMQEIRVPYLRKLTDLYYSHITDSSVVIDEARNWQCVTNVEMYIKIFGKRPKIICPVRNVEEIMASFIKVFENNNLKWSYEKDARGETFEKPYLQLKNLYDSKYRDCLMFVDYNNLTDDPNKVLNNIYDFIEQPVYNHDLDSVKSNKSYKHIDDVYNLTGLHEIKSGVTKSITSPGSILSNEQLYKFEELTFWH